MNRSEIIKLAFEKSSDAREALGVAREIEAFLGEHPTQSVNPKKRFWTTAEIEKLHAMYLEGLSIGTIAEKLGRSFNSTEAAIKRLDRNEPIGRQK